MTSTRKSGDRMSKTLPMSAGENRTRPLIFLDFDDVIAVNKFYGGYDVVSPGPKPSDLYQKLFHPPSVALLLRVVEEYRPAVVITTSWLRFFERDGMQDLLSRTGLTAVAASLHIAWEAPPERLMSRRGQIDRWFANHHRGESYVILDDKSSGTELLDSPHDKAGRVVWCQERVGLHEGHLTQISTALTVPWQPESRSRRGRR